MPPTRQPRDLFADARLQPIANSARGNGRPVSRHGPRSNTTAAPSRAPPQRNLFAPALSRRPTSMTPSVQHEILADIDSEEEDTTDLRQRQNRRTRPGSPAARSGKAKAQFEDIVKRQPDGNYLLTHGGTTGVVPHLAAVDMPEEEAMLAEMDDRFTSMAREYFASGVASRSRHSKKQEDDFDDLVPQMLGRLHEQARDRIEEERWMFEPIDRYRH